MADWQMDASKAKDTNMIDSVDGHQMGQRCLSETINNSDGARVASG